MKKQFIYISIILVLFSPIYIFGQEKKTEKTDPNFFNEKAAYQLAKDKGIKPSEINGYVQYLKHDFSSKKALEHKKNHHASFNNNATEIQETVIYLSPNQPMSLGCPNMGFEQYNFNGWTGGKGTVSTGPIGGNPNYTSTGTAIANAAGDNVSLLNTINYHTLMTIPATNSVYPFCVGYDSLAVRAVGSTTVSDIPFVSPYSFDPISVRLNSANGNNRAARLKYITTTSSTNKRLSFSYAVVLNDPSSSAHAPEESPYFKVEVKNESNGSILPGCSSYTFNPKTASTSDSLQNSELEIYGDVIKYRKWQYYSVDLSSLPLGTNVSINFEVGGCSFGAHTGYAYVDAECGGIGQPYANMCSGSNFATLIAPTGFTSYQWVGPSGLINGATNDTLIENPANVGDTYTVNMVSPGGCVISQTVSVGLTTVNIININSTSSCAGGNSGTAHVEASGSNGIYTYTWTNTSTGAIVSNSQTATDLAAGSYSVLVASSACGQASANLSVGVSPPTFLSLPKTFCGNLTYIAQPGGSDYTWYNGNTIIPAPIGNNDTLQINSPNTGDIYTVVYKNAQGCKDSIEYTLNEVLGGSIYLSNTNNVCLNNTNGSTVINLSTPYTAPYNYFLYDQNSAVISTTTSTEPTFSVTNLATGNYSVIVNDGVCVYNKTLAITVIQTNFTVTPVNETLCFPAEAKINLTFENTMPTSCGADPVICSGSQIQLFNSGPYFNNSSTNYPSPFSGWWYSAKQQFLIQASDLIAAGVNAGKISSLAFNVTALNSSPNSYPDYEIKMGCTTFTSLPTGGSQPFVTGLTSVYYNANQPVSLGWLTHNFSQAYVWDGVSNLIVEVCTSPLSSAPANASIELKQMSYNSNMKFVSTSSGGTSCSSNNSNTSGVYMTNGAKMIPNMKFGYCAAAPAANTYSLQISSNGTITTNYANDSIRVEPNFTIPPTGNGSVIYTISVTNPIGGCVETKTVEILYPPLTTSISAVANSSIICLGESTNLSATGASIYNWYSLQNGTLTPISSSASLTTVPITSGATSYVVTGTLSCPGSVPDTKTVTVNVKPLTNLSISNLKDVTKCLNTSVLLNPTVSSNSSLNTGTPYSYIWTTLPGNIPAIGTNTNSTYFESSNTTTSLVVTVNGNCANSVTDTVQVSNFANDISALISNSLSICQNTDFTLNSIVSGGRPDYNYSWIISPSSNTISTSQNLTYTSPETAGIYTITLNVIDSCSYQYSDFETIIVLPPCNITIPNVITANGDNINDYFKITNIEYHPNTSVTIFDRWGRKVYENSNYNNTWKADDLNDGTYFYVIDVVDDKKYNGFITIFKGK